MIINTDTREVETVREIRNKTGVVLSALPMSDVLSQLEPPRAYVRDIDPPEGDVVYQDGFEKVDGEWQAKWVARPFTVEEKAERDQQRIAGLLSEIEFQRKQAEEVGVTHEGMRFSGSPANRQYLSEALQFAQAVGVETFDTWKDSDNRFHARVPVATVTEAFQQIGLRRDALFKREQQYAEQIDAGELLSAEGLDWAL